MRWIMFRGSTGEAAPRPLSRGVTAVRAAHASMAWGCFMKQVATLFLVVGMAVGACTDSPVVEERSAETELALDHGQSGSSLLATETAVGFDERTITYDWTLTKT